MQKDKREVIGNPLGGCSAFFLKANGELLKQNFVSEEWGIKSNSVSFEYDVN